MPVTDPVTIIGGGLAGSEAAWQLATREVPVSLLEMRPLRMTPAHSTDDLAELVCSNSLKSDDPSTATGLLKRELAALDSLILTCARETVLPAGSALAVDRDAFSARVTSRLEDHPLITVVREEAVSIPPERPLIIATGPLTSEVFASSMSALVGDDRLAFYDAASIIVDAATVDSSQVYAASRYGKGEGADYLNCPLDEAAYALLRESLCDAERVRPKGFENESLFEACLPIEQLAMRGEDALRYGPLKPVGLPHPETGEIPYAVVQLRAENRDRTAYNLVGFQTGLTFPEQRKILSLIPGLQTADVLRFGVMHRNTFVDAPRVLDPGLQVPGSGGVWLAGQLTGTEGYLEAAGSGLIAALNAHAFLVGAPMVALPRTTALGSLLAYATSPDTLDYQPMHVNFGLVPPLDPPVSGKRRRYAAYSARAQSDLADFLERRAGMPSPEGERP